MPKLFAFGVFLLISNFIVGKLALPLFAIDFYLGLGVYVFSWFMLGAGILLSGKEGWRIAKTWTSEKKVLLQTSLFRRPVKENPADKL